eukprot:PhF_6_TR839/c0_g1_i1/m.1265
MSAPPQNSLPDDIYMISSNNNNITLALRSSGTGFWYHWSAIEMKMGTIKTTLSMEPPWGRRYYIGNTMRSRKDIGEYVSRANGPLQNLLISSPKPKDVVNNEVFQDLAEFLGLEQQYQKGLKTLKAGGPVEWAVWGLQVARRVLPN